VLNNIHTWFINIFGENIVVIFIKSLKSFQASWKDLVLTDIAFKIIAFIILVPLTFILFDAMMFLSGRGILVDADIAQFFLEPVGLVCLILVSASFATIVVLEQTVMLVILCARSHQRSVYMVDALRITARKYLPLLKTMTVVSVVVLLILAPFIVLGQWVYTSYLTEFDINYYLSYRPPEFYKAFCIMVLLAAVAVFLIASLLIRWLLALPILLFESDKGLKVLHHSRKRSVGHHRMLLIFIVGWFLTTVFISTLITIVTSVLGQWIFSFLGGSLSFDAFLIGSLLFLWSGTNLFFSLIAAISFACLLFNIYQHVGDPQPELIDKIRTTELERDRFGLTWQRLVVSLIVCFVLVLLVGINEIQEFNVEDNTRITAHRGSSIKAPENTLAAVKQAIDDGTDYVEIDVQETADGNVVVIHDSDLQKIAGNSIKIWEATMQDLERIDIGSNFGAEFKDERIPLLSDVLELARGRVRVNIELKYYGHAEQLEQRVIDVVEKAGMEANIIIMSLSTRGLLKIKSLRPDWKLGLLSAIAISDITGIDADFFAVNANLATRTFITAAHSKGKEVHVWTVNDAWKMSTMIGRGVDNLITDDPALARQVINERAEMSLFERYLVYLASTLDIKPQSYQM
jgi:glycerophosphoryl diester phosphodiesterase